MNPKLTETIYVDFITSSPTTGAAADADATPTCEVFEDATDTATLSPTVVKRTGKVGNYRVPVACTSANGFEAGKSYNVVVSATVGAVAAKAIIRTFQMRTLCIDDPLTLTSAYDPAKTAMQAGPVTVGTNNDKTGYSLTAAYDPAKLAAPVGAAMTLTPAYDAAKTAATQASVNTLTTYVDTEVASILAKTNNLPADPASASTIASSFTTVNTKLDTIDDFVDTEVGAIKAKTDNLPADPASNTSMTAAFAITNGKIDVVDDYVDTEVGAIKAKTDQLTFTGGKVDANATLAIAPTDLNAIADALLKRDWNSVTGEAAYSALNAFRMLRNVWNTTGGTLSVKKEDGTTNAWTRTLATDPLAQPITGAS